MSKTICFVRTFAGYLRNCACFLRTCCLWLKDLGTNRLQILSYKRPNLQYTVAITGRVVGPCLTDGAGEQKQMCAYAAYVPKNCIRHKLFASCRSHTQHNSNAKMLVKYFWRHLISDRLIQIGQSDMSTRFAH